VHGFLSVQAGHYSVSSRAVQPGDNGDTNACGRPWKYFTELIQLNRKFPEIYRTAVVSANEADRISLEFGLDSWGISSRRTVFGRRRQYLRKPIMKR
jgi:hypothetical protein